ncbi:MAG: MerR family transcriptional regulator [Chloroflexi bacterium]|nr:MerR family transcriptional regulator [Chloroflexota bacterium]
MTRRQWLRTSDVARAVGVHPNTVRLYEAWGLLPPIPRAPNGYRQYTQRHLLQMRLARTAMRCTWAGGPIRRTTLAVVHLAAGNDLPAALDAAYSLQALIASEQAQAEAAVRVLENWAQGGGSENLPRPLRIGEAAKHLNVTIDMLRNWERNGLLDVPRTPGDGYRAYGSREISRLRVIRTLGRARYSTMSILRMLRALDSGQPANLREVLDTPAPDEADALYVTDRWLTTLAEMCYSAEEIITLIQTMMAQPGA